MVRVYDLADGPAEGAVYYEIKNVNRFRLRDKEEMLSDLAIFGDSGSLEELKWRFMGIPGQENGPPSVEAVKQSMENFIKEQGLPGGRESQLLSYLDELDIGHFGPRCPFPISE